MKDAIQVITPLALAVTCCTLFGLEQVGQGFIFLGLSSGTWATLSGLGALVSFAALFIWR